MTDEHKKVVDSYRRRLAERRNRFIENKLREERDEQKARLAKITEAVGRTRKDISAKDVMDKLKEARDA